MEGEWALVADGVWVRRYGALDLTVGLVVGAESALVIDVRGDHRQGAELAGAVREVTALPLRVAITHGHFDHCFGAAAFRPAQVWAHERYPKHVAATAEAQRARWTEHFRTEHPDTARALAESVPATADHLVSDTTSLDLGDRAVRLIHPGIGHTDHDLIVEIPDARVVFAGDLVEQGAPPDFEDAHPLHWPSTMDAIRALSPTIVVPGHGDPVGPDFVRAQRDELAKLAEICRAHRDDALSPDEAVRNSPYPRETTLAALSRV